MPPRVCPICLAPRPVLTVGRIVIDLIERRVAVAGRTISLRHREFALLVVLARDAGSVVSRARLLEVVWGLRRDPGTNVVAVHVSRLRGAIEGGDGRVLLHTVRGRGYMLDAGTPGA